MVRKREMRWAGVSNINACGNSYGEILFWLRHIKVTYRVHGSKCVC